MNTIRRFKMSMAYSFQKMTANFLAYVSQPKSMFALNLDSWIQGLEDGAEFLFDLVIALLPLVIILGIFVLLIVKFKGN